MTIAVLPELGEVRAQTTAPMSSRWRTIFADTDNVVEMTSSETRKGNELISFRELGSRRTVPLAAWKQYRKAVTEDDQGHYSQSFRLATSAATLCPAFSDAHSALAVWHLRNLDLPNGEREIRIALHLDPSSLGPRELLGLLQLMRSELLDARLTLEAVVTSDPTRSLAQYFLALTLDQLGEANKAAAHLKLRLGSPTPPGPGVSSVGFRRRSRLIPERSAFVPE